MIPAGVQVYVASTPVDFRKGAMGLMALVRDGGADPFSGALYVFRSKRADRIKAVWFDGTGVCLFAKTLEETQFCWPRIGLATVQLNHTQLLGCSQRIPRTISDAFAFATPREKLRWIERKRRM